MSTNVQPAAARRILLVEDERVVAMDMELQLVAFGYEVIGIAATGKEALRLAGLIKPDLVVMDIHLRGPLDGFATAEELRRRNPIPVVFVTAFGNEEAQRRAKAVNSQGYLTKPYRPEDLRAVITAAFA